MTSFRAKLDSGQPQFGLCVMYPAPGIIERIGADWDWIWLDGQHGELDFADILALVRACDSVGTPAFVRVAGQDYGSIGRALDTGAAGIIIPCVDAPEQAAEMVAAAKYPPLGNRSYGSRRLVDTRGRGYVNSANEDTLLIVQIESPLAMENADRIAAVPGVDCLFLGPDDLRLRRGVDLSLPMTPAMMEADYRHVVAACRNHGKYALTPGGSGELMKLCIESGFNMIVGGADSGFLSGGSQQALAAARGMVAPSNTTGMA